MAKPIEQPSYLPLSRAEMRRLGWDELDVLLISGDAYIDHPSFASALLGRWLIKCGFRVGLITQPRWDTIEDITALGRPRLFAGISAGALDSMVAHYTAFRKKRHDDAYTPGGEAGHRPNRATIAYTNLVKQAFPGLPTVLGGLEASLRRQAHYDFWSDSLRRPLLFDSKADILVYGMGERAITEIAQRLAARLDHAPSQPLAEALANIAGTAIISSDIPPDSIALPSYEDIQEHHEKLMEATLALEKQVHDGAPTLTQQVGQRTLIIHPPAAPLSSDELDALYSLPYQRSAHPSYRTPIPAQDMIHFSITTHRGCGGGCSFCSLALHQGRRITSRSAQSIIAEAKALVKHPDFRGSISDIGGPSANMWRCACRNTKTCGRTSCLVPEVCPLFQDAQMQYVELLRTIARLPGIKHVRIASGIRHDWALHNPAALKAYIAEFTGGQLKVAPEHSEAKVLQLMRKPNMHKFEAFLRYFYENSQACGKEQYVIPYLLSAFPGCSEGDMRHTAQWLRSRNWQPQQVQCFIPTPGTVATAMYWTGLSPEGTPIYVARNDAERLRQHAILIPNSGNAPPSRQRQHSRTNAPTERYPDQGNARRTGSGPQANHPHTKPHTHASRDHSADKAHRGQSAHRAKKGHR